VIFQYRFQRVSFEPCAMARRARLRMYSRLGLGDQKLLAMRTRHLAQPLAHFLDQLRIALSRPLIFARGFGIMNLVTETVLVVALA